MARKRVQSKQLRLTVPVSAADRLERLADAFACDVPTLLRFMVSSQLVQWEAMYLHPERLMEAAQQASGPGSVTATMARQFADEVTELAGGGELRPGPGAPGFRPGGKPRSHHEPHEVVTVPGGEWSGYLHGL